MKRKTDLLVIIAITLLLSAVSIMVFNLQFGFIKITSQLIRVAATVFFSYKLYQEKIWAKWLFVIWFFLAGFAVMFMGGSVIGKTGIWVVSLIFSTSLFYFASAIYLAFIRKWE